MRIWDRELKGVVWDWGDTLMRDIPGQVGPMVTWPEVEAMPGAREALFTLSPLGVHCVATNAQESSSEDVAKALGRVGLRGLLDHFFTSGELGANKPDPAFFHAVARELGLPPSSLLSIGNDLRKDIQPAKVAGMTTILISSSVTSRGLEVPDLVVPDLAHLVELARAEGWS